MIYPESQKQHYKRMKLYEKASGFEEPNALSDQELLELILTYPILRANVAPIAKRLLAEFGSLGEVLGADRRDLLFLPGVSADSAAFIKLIDHIRKNMPYRPGDGAEANKGQNEPIAEDAVPAGFASVKEACLFCSRELAEYKSERVLELLISLNGRLLGYMLVAGGGGESVEMPVDIIVDNAKRPGVRGVVIAHNHPSGSPRPSLSDIEATRALSSALEACGLRLYEHFIIGSEECYAMVGDQTISADEEADTTPKQ